MENIVSRIIHNKIKEITERKNKKAGSAKKKINGDIIVGKEEVKQRWTALMKTLFEDERKKN